MSHVPTRLEVETAQVVAGAGSSKADNSGVKKYFFQRYRLFHRFDEGIKLDDVSWFSVTPEKIGAHIARRFAGMDVTMDLYSGAGGNSIQFALAGSYVIGVENNLDRIAMAMNNAEVYGVKQYIDFIHGDVYEILPTLNTCITPIDAIFMSPPWGGPDYKGCDFFDVRVFQKVINLALSVSNNVAVLVPRNIDYDNVLKCLGPCEVESNYLGNTLKTATIYFGGLVGRDPLQHICEPAMDNMQVDTNPDVVHPNNLTSLI